MKKLIAFAAVAATVSGCAELYTTDEGTRGGLMPSWRASTILGGGDGNATDRREGRVTGTQRVEAGQGTIYPGRNPLFRDSDFVNENGERTVSLNLVDVSVSEAAQAILGELLNENYVLDPGVSGTVNIRSTRPISRTTAIEVFELALRQNNAALIRRGEVFAITPLSGDLSIGASTSRDVLPGYTLRVIPLENIGAQEMAAILQPFAGDGIVGIDAQRNIIVLAGTSVDQRAWQKTIDSFDVDWLANRSVGIFPISGRSAQSIVSGLELVVETDENFEPLVVFQVIPENNSILAVAKTPRALQNISNWVQRLTAEGANDAQVYSYDMKFARASVVAPTLAEILGIQVTTVASEADASAEVDPTAATTGAATLDQNATRIVASEATNTLLIRATREEYERVLGMLHRLDVPPRQVLVEANIVEVRLTDDLRYGVQWFFEDGNSSISLDNNATAGLQQTLPGFNAVFDEAPRAVIDALDDVTSVNVVSSPNLMILNNESARLVVGDQIPVATQQAQDGTQNDEVFVSTVEFRDTGVIFEVTPRINSSGSVVLDITQEISTVAAEDAETLTPTISQRVISSSVAVDSGETIALGGLFSTSQTRGNSGVPGLKDIPVAGKLFGRTSENSDSTELLVLITPRIVNDVMDARRVTRQLRNRVRDLRLDDATLSTAIQVPSLATQNSAYVSQLDGQTVATAAPEPASRSNAAAALPAPQPQAAVATSTLPANTGGGQYYAYLGSFGSETAAKQHWQSLAVNNAAILKGVEPRYEKAGSMTAVAIGPFMQNVATEMCVRIKTECYTAVAN
ncbi:MAG: type II secretion system secretin GspD [Pseudomonadota bacterium]